MSHCLGKLKKIWCLEGLVVVRVILLATGTVSKTLTGSRDDLGLLQSQKSSWCHLFANFFVIACSAKPLFVNKREPYSNLLPKAFR